MKTYDLFINNQQINIRTFESNYKDNIIKGIKKENVLNGKKELKLLTDFLSIKLSF